jgi:putative ABC transport system permease protein
VNEVSVTSDIPGKTIVGKNSVCKANEDASHNFVTYIMQVDNHFVKALQVKLTAGRNFRTDDTTNKNIKGPQPAPVIINEALVKGLGFKTNEAALQQMILLTYGPSGVHRCQIIGVLKDYHQRSLREAYDPILYFYPDNYGYGGYFTLNINTQNLQQHLASMKEAYGAIFAGAPFDYFFLNDYFNSQYKADQQFGNVFGLFTMLAIFIACLGLLGLSSYMIRLRTQEIGIRRVLGASVYSILALFSKDFVRMIGLASVIAIPVIYFMAYRWLSNYAFHIGLAWYIFLIPPLVLLVISLTIIVWQSSRAALNNPVSSLRSE